MDYITCIRDHFSPFSFRNQSFRLGSCSWLRRSKLFNVNKIRETQTQEKGHCHKRSIFLRPGCQLANQKGFQKLKHVIGPQYKLGASCIATVARSNPPWLRGKRSSKERNPKKRDTKESMQIFFYSLWGSCSNVSYDKWAIHYYNISKHYDNSSLCVYIYLNNSYLES